MTIKNFAALMTLILIAYGITHYINKSSPFASSNPTPAPIFTMTDLQGTPLTNETLKGQITLINFWATWCAPCVVEFPRLVELAEQNPDTITLIALSSDQDTDTIKTFIAKKENKPRSPNMHIVHDKDALTGKTFKTFMLPETILIDAQGKIRKKFIGADWTVQDIQTSIDQYKN